MRKKFNCTKEFVLNECKGRCCFSKAPIYLTLTPEEEKYFEKILPKVEVNLNKIRKCYFQDEQNLCTVHGTDRQPFGCVVSPFAINRNNTLIIRHRAISFKCINKGQLAYITFRHSLDRLFGLETAKFIVDKLENTKADFYVEADKSLIDLYHNKNRKIFFNIVNA